MDLYQLKYNKSLLNAGLFLRNIFYLMTELTGGFVLRILTKITPHSPYFSGYNSHKDTFPHPVNKILAVRTDRMGDLILSTPALYALRSGFPQAKISLLIDEKNLDLVKNNPDFDHIIICRRNQGLKGYISLINYLRKIRFDMTLNLYSSFRWHLVSFLTGAKYRYGYKAKGAGFLLTCALKDTRFNQPRHEVETTLDLIRAVNIPIPDKNPRIYVTDEAKKNITSFLEKHSYDGKRPLIAIHPGAYAPRIRWDIKNFARSADLLTEKYNTVIIVVGSQEEINLSQHFLELTKSKPINACGRTTLQELAALLSSCYLFIGNSSGPMHLAAAVGVPTIAIFGNTYPLDSYQRWEPWGKQSVVLHKDMGCKKCLPWSCRDMKCLKAITPEDILQAADKFLKTFY